MAGAGEGIWSSVAPGQVVAVVGMRVPPAPPDWRVVRIHCGGPQEALRPLHEAIQRIDHLVGQPAAFERSVRRVRRGLRAYVLGEDSRPGLADIAGALNRLADTAPHTALIFDRIELADLDTLSTLRRLLAQPGWLRPALLLQAAQPLSPETEAGALIATLPQHTAPPASAEAPLPSLEAVPWEARRALRAAATIGEGFEVELLGALLGVDPLRALEWLQAAHDGGAPLEDLGGGRFHMPPALAARLREELLPSLAQAWHRRLAEILVPPAPTPAPEPAPPADLGLDVPEPRAAEADAAVEVEPEPVGAAPIPVPDVVDVEPEEIEGVSPPQARPAWSPAAPPPAVVTDTVDVEPLEDEDEAAVAPEAAAPEAVAVEAPAPAGGGGEGGAARLAEALGPAAGPSRAAEHLGAAGEVAAAARAWLSAAQQATPVAMLHLVARGERILRVLEGVLPREPVLVVEVLAELGRLKLEGCAPGGCFRLDDALADLERALWAAQAVGPGAISATLEARIRGDIALACYEKGDAAALERALAELTQASRSLLDAGEPLLAARLLNDQAAVWVRLGDPVRAAGLLKESRRLFSRLDEGPVRDRELAETYLLLARLPLHVAPRPGAEREALQAALGHAHDAARMYERLRLPREAARAREVAGRLHLRAGDVPRAAEALQEALRVQSAVGDALGMAQTTGALAELARQQGRVGEALRLLMASIQLNLTRGSPLGLQHNRAGLAALAGLLPAPALLQAEAALRQAEARLGVGRADRAEGAV